MNTLFETSGTLSPVASRSHICFTVFLAEPIECLKIDFSYTPKVLLDQEHAEVLRKEGEARYFNDPRFPNNALKTSGDLTNLLTLSFDDAHGFRGACHRHPSVQHLYLGKDRASPGLLSGIIPPGLLRVTLSVHSVITKACDYSLCIFREES